MAGEEKKEEKRILVVAVESKCMRLPDGNGKKKKPRDLRPLVKYMEDKLKKPATIIAVAAPRKDLKDAIKSELTKHTYHAIVSIGSSPTQFAKEVVDELSGGDPAKRIPIVFTAVSDPLEQHFVQRDPKDGKLYGNRLTGVSRGLQQTLRNWAEKSSGFFKGKIDLYWIHRPDIYPSHAAHEDLMKSGALPGNVCPRPIDLKEDADWNDIAQALGKLPTKPKQAGFLMIPDALVVARAADCIGIVQEGKRIPVFVQQLEWVCPGWDTGGPYALAGYGVTPRWVGEELAEIVDDVLDDPEAASKRAVEFPPGHEFQFWYNPEVVQQLKKAGVTVTVPAAAKPSGGARAGTSKKALKRKPTRSGKAKKAQKRRR